MLEASRIEFAWAPHRRGLVAALLAVALSVGVGMLGLKSLLLPAAFWCILLLALGLFKLRPKALDLLIFLLPLTWVIAPGATGVKQIYIVAVWLGLLLALLYIQLLQRGLQDATLRSPFALILIAYIGIFIASAFAHPPSQSTFKAAPQILSLILIYWLFGQFVRTEDILRVFRSLALGCAAGALGFIIAFSRGSPQAALAGMAYGIMRPIVWEFNANVWAIYPLFGIPLMWGLMLLLPKRRLDWFWQIPVFLILTLAAVMTMSRSALLGVAAGCGFIMLTQRTTRRILWFSLPAGLLAMAIIKPEIFAAIETMLRVQKGLSGRGALWTVAFNVMAEYPLLGVGPGWFIGRFFLLAPFMPNGLHTLATQPSAHSAFFNIGAEMGIFAMLLALSVFMLFARRSARLWPQVKNSPSRSIFIMLNALMLAGFMRALFETDFIEPHGYITSNLLLLLLLAMQDRLYSQYHPAA